jgi:hypothetical protein
MVYSRIDLVLGAASVVLSFQPKHAAGAQVRPPRGEAQPPDPQPLYPPTQSPAPSISTHDP